MGILVKCEDCGERFDSCNLLKVCAPCMANRDEIYLEVKERMSQNQGMKMRTICEELNLSERVTAHILKKDREEMETIREKNMRKFLKDNINALR